MAIAQTQEWPQTANHRQFTRLLARSCSWNTTPFHTMPYHAIPYITHWPTAAALASSRTTYPLPWAFCLNPVTATILSPPLCCNLTAAPQRYKDSSARCFNLWRAWKNVSQDMNHNSERAFQGYLDTLQAITTSHGIMARGQLPLVWKLNFFPRRPTLRWFWEEAEFAMHNWLQSFDRKSQNFLLTLSEIQALNTNWRVIHL